VGHDPRSRARCAQARHDIRELTEQDGEDIVRSRIVRRAVAAATVATLLFGLPLAVAVAFYYQQDERGELERVADGVALSVIDDLITHRPVAQLPAANAESQLGLYTASGHRLAGSGPDALESTADGARGGTPTYDESGNELVVTVPLIDRAQLIGIVRGSTLQTEASTRTAVTWLAMVALAALTIGATWLLARRMAAGLARPLEELAGTAHRLGDGDFTVTTGHSGIPEIDEVGATLTATAHRISDMLARERAFSAHASHQLRTPLAGLRLQLETALDSPAATRESIANSVAGAISTTDRLEQTIDDLLSLARDNSKAIQLADLADLLDEIDTTWHALLAAHGRALRISHPPGADPYASPAAIRQILNVLIDNAVTHGRGTVALATRDAGGVLAIDVHDEGPGIDPERDVFAAAGEQPSHRGRGIGLPLARSLAEAEGGRLVLSRPCPPTFTLLLPID
jgi:signal transduction histidine kinase